MQEKQRVDPPNSKSPITKTMILMPPKRGGQIYILFLEQVSPAWLSKKDSKQAYFCALQNFSLTRFKDGYTNKKKTIKTMITGKIQVFLAVSVCYHVR